MWFYCATLHPIDINIYFKSINIWNIHKRISADMNITRITHYSTYYAKTKF